MFASQRRTGWSLSTVLLVLAVTSWPVFAAHGTGLTLKGQYAFSMVGNALVSSGGSTPSLVPVGIFGSITFNPDGTIGGSADVDVGGLNCIVFGPGPGATQLSGNYSVLAKGPTGPFATANVAIATTTGQPPSAGIGCVQLTFSAPNTYTPGDFGGWVLMGDPSGKALDIFVERGSGAIQGLNNSGAQETVSDLSGSGRATLVTNAQGGFPGPGEP